MKTALMACGFLLAALPLAARADDLPAVPDLMLRLQGPPSDAPLMRRDDDDYPGYGRRGYRPQARQGLLISFGLGGGSMRYPGTAGYDHIGAFDFDFRLGYGFSDQFQMFMDFNADGGSNYHGDDVGSWTWTIRGQTVLIGDRRGNGLNLNFGAGFGGLTYNANSYYGGSSSPTGLALAGGLSYDARITPWFSFSPEFFYTWHQVPNPPGFPDDVTQVYGVRLNFLWYLH